MKSTIKIRLSGGFHNSGEIRFIVPASRWDDFKNGHIGIRDVLSKNQEMRADRHFCGIDGCMCGGLNRADIEEVYEEPIGRKPKGTETRKAVTFRLQPSTIERIKEMAAENGMSQSDFIEKIAKVE